VADTEPAWDLSQSHRQGCVIATQDRVHSYFVMHMAALSFVVSLHAQKGSLMVNGLLL